MSSNEGRPVADTATVRVWSGTPRESYETILESEPTEYDLAVVDGDTYHIPHDDHVELAESIEHHGKYAFLIEPETPLELHVETSDHYYDTVEGFTQGRSVEGGLSFSPDQGEVTPFQTELWGAVRMRVEEVAA